VPGTLVLEGVNERNLRDVVFVTREGEKGGSLRDFQPIEVHSGTSCQKIVSFVHSSRLPVGILLWGLAEPPAQSNEPDANPNGPRRARCRSRRISNELDCSLHHWQAYSLVCDCRSVASQKPSVGRSPSQRGAAMVGGSFPSRPSLEETKPHPNPIGLYLIDPMTSLTSITRLLTVN
jgi:hypothetical protein